MIQRSEIPEVERHLSRPKPDLKAWMRSGLVNVMSITFGDFTLPSQFS
jgi:hypothetical protein